MSNFNEIPSAFKDLFTPSRYKAYHGGRGSAKSHSMASAVVLKGAQKPIRWLFAREIQKSLSASVHQLLTDKINLHGLQDMYKVTREGIKGVNGTLFLFAGLRSNPDSIKSMEGLDGVWVEEADRCSQTSLDLLTPTVRKEGSEIWFSWNRNQTTDPVDNMFLGGTPPPNSIVKQVNWRDNPFFPEVLREEMEWMKARDIDKWRHIWEGEPLSRSEAKVFQNWTVEDLDHRIPAGTTARFGADWGFSKDPTVLIKSYKWGRTLYISDEAFRVKCNVDEIPALFGGTDTRHPKRWANKFNNPGIDGVMQGLIVADSARPEIVSYMKSRGFNIKSALKGKNSVEDGVEFLQSCDIVVNPRCKNTIDELSLYSYKIDDITDEILPELEDKHNHVIDALRYSYEAERRHSRIRLVSSIPRVVNL